ncbi:nitrogenase iron-molybdenum cofactor biosynthesis protein NifN [Azoarcus sp. DN11]|uniref:nitrogenase iron-molybdenum cofactor biosynthesis protein NifN n=1 Tax=Azoarcus sp. DN11 TaxID=356837 RepID=UPI000EB43191|nr:nitrogenase iron-molybdenum cofactor biosynthesis protein NifN [Azoarcus sp. DN11]AYH43402.1 nitrogenase iron-molybdenum cofactor biosynthesis protein NifN [Azoarcus sp. DN11]
MAEILAGRKACTVNPLKMSAPIGAALAFLGMDRCLPLLHGSQGCTAFGLVLFVRHFRETIPLQTTAMSEVTTILGGQENIEQALVNIHKRANPALIGLCSTGITEAKGDDVAGFLTDIRARHPELAGMEVVFTPTPDFVGGFQEGWGKAVECMVTSLVRPSKVRTPWQVNILAPCHLTPGDLEELREIVEAFGLYPVILPDLSGSLDGHIPETFLPHTLGGTRVEDVRRMGEAALTIAIGEQMRPAAAALERIAGVPFRLFDRLTGLAASDALIGLLAEVSGNEVPAKYKRQRSQLLDAMLDGHFYFGGKRIAVAGEADLLHTLVSFFTEMGAEVPVAVAPTETPILPQLPCATVRIGDLDDFEHAAAAVEEGCDLLVTHSHGRQAAQRLGLPLYRAGIPSFDRLGATHQVSVGYRGTRNLIFEVANVFIARLNDHEQHASPADFHPAGRGEAAGGALEPPPVTRH